LYCFVCNGLNGHVLSFSRVWFVLLIYVLVMYFYDILIMLSSDENFIITSFWHTMVCLSNEDVVPDVCFVCMLL
jgi:hypothetical protein